jgi:predicted Zn-dependent peptidase
LPEDRFRLGDPKKTTALVPLPKTIVNEIHRPIFREHDVRLSRVVFGVNAVAESHPMKALAHHDLGLGILGADPRHHRGPGHGRLVRHACPVWGAVRPCW